MVNCEWFHIVDWDEKTNEIYHALCTRPSPAWPNCNKCQHKAEYQDITEEEETPSDPNNPTLMTGAHSAVLLQSDVDTLDGSINHCIRLTETHDTEVRRLYKIWKSL
jgi:hypothetical protein